LIFTGVGTAYYGFAAVTEAVGRRAITRDSG